MNDLTKLILSLTLLSGGSWILGYAYGSCALKESTELAWWNGYMRGVESNNQKQLFSKGWRKKGKEA